MSAAPSTVLVVEDGDEYTAGLSRLVPGPRWLQVRDGAAALAALRREVVALVWLDLRFDRIPASALLGGAGGKEEGLSILAALRGAGHRQPVLLASDFGRESARFARLVALHGPLQFVPDGAGPAAIREQIEALLPR